MSSTYLFWNQQCIQDSSPEQITSWYNLGYVFTRIGKGCMDQTRSVRIDLSQFELSSENRRILKKTKELNHISHRLPYSAYHWSIGKVGKDFYESKFGEHTFSANKIKELLTTPHNFNALLEYKIPSESKDSESIGYCIAYENEQILHYSYPFYNDAQHIPNIGMGMMLLAILYARETQKQYVYLGSAQRPTDVYKLQFSGIEWFDGHTWQQDTNQLKQILTALT